MTSTLALDLSFLLTLIRCAFAAVFLMLGTVTTVIWRQQIAAGAAASAAPGAPAGPRAGAGLLPYLAALYYAMGLLVAVWGRA